MSDELELKYAVDDPTAVEEFLDIRFPPAPEDAGWRRQTTTDRYFDTADGALARAGFGARLRRTGGRTTVGLKSDVAIDAGVHHRRELEAEATQRLEPAEWSPSEARDLVLRVTGGRQLRERFVLRQQRRERDWQAGGGACVFSLDDVDVRRGRERVGHMRQLEVELRDGNRRLLRSIDAAIVAGGLAVHEPRSKMVIAAAMVEAAAPMRGDEPFAEAGRRVLRRHLERMIERERATRAGDALALKQMRVATRRMRATWRLFDGAYRRKAQGRYMRELRRIARRLGAVRDMDVLLAGLPEEQHLAPLADAWRERRAAAWEELLAALDSEQYASFVADYREFTYGSGLAVRSSVAGLRVRDVAGSRLWSAYERLRAHEPSVLTAAGDRPDTPTLHAVRIDGKRLRYALETFADVLPRDIKADLIARVTRLQDDLGALNDADIAARETAAWLKTDGRSATAQARAAADAYLADRQTAVERLRRSFHAAWRPIGGTDFGRRLALALAHV